VKLKMSERYVVTTPIYYVNAGPHIGTVLTTLVADVSARYARMRGKKTFFLTGTDENALKVKEAADHAGLEPNVFVEQISATFRDAFRGMNLAYDDFIRTSEERHHRAVQRFYSILRESGYIYGDRYEGWYDVSSETFYKESDLVNGKSPDGNPVRWISEDNEFFRLSAFGDRLLEHIESHPEFIVPESRRNEVISFIKMGLRDMCVTRQNHGWGIPVPGDDGKVVYVWFDAVINYIAASGWPDDPNWQERWPADVHWMGKDILTRFHATLWPAMLMGAGLPLPKRVAAHAHIMKDGEKMSKSKGNVVAPLDLATELAAASGCRPEIAVDAVRYVLISLFPSEDDTDFTQAEFDRRYNSDLANDLGNALNRSLAMAQKFVGGQVPEATVEEEALRAISAAKKGFEEAMDAFRVDRTLDATWSLVRFLNKYIDTRAPWALAKAQDPALASVIRSMLLCLRAAADLIRPIMPTVADEILVQLGIPGAPSSWDAIGALDSLPPSVALGNPIPIFPRLDLNLKPKPMSTPTPEPKSAAPAAAPASTPAEITIEDFAKVQLRIARVLDAEPLEGSDKLMKLQVVIGDEKRQIIAGIRKSYEPIDLIGRQIVVVANLKPAKLRGAESQGMLLAATDAAGNAILLQPEREAPEGAGVK
jgi:methionyl-tRNA synthetase